MLYTNEIHDSISTKWNVMVHEAVVLAYYSKSSLANSLRNDSGILK